MEKKEEEKNRVKYHDTVSYRKVSRNRNNIRASSRQNLQKWHVRPAKTQISLGIPRSDQSLLCPHKEILGIKLPI